MRPFVEQIKMRKQLYHTRFILFSPPACDSGNEIDCGRPPERTKVSRNMLLCLPPGLRNLKCCGGARVINLFILPLLGMWWLKKLAVRAGKGEGRHEPSLEFPFRY